MWPWQRQRIAVEGVRHEVEEAVAGKLAAHKRREFAHRQAVQAEAMSSKLRREIAKNGFTELLQQAMGRR